MPLSKRDVVELWFSEVWDAHNIAALDQCLAPSLAEDSPLYGGLALRKDIPLLIEVFHRLIGPMKTEILVYLEDGDWVSVHYQTTASGVNNVTPIKVNNLLMFRFEQGRIAEMISRINSLSLFEQLGQMPPDTLMGCFSGQSLTWK
ncbi:ester cyclase [Phaeobacter sp. 11ANDIMAR09]|uniref:ester cyclase n=1 Tax=Phaeobacter sp. 11ANDIMAR09 TaxID=1225647 RepID=UPI0006C89638|nr:nuclear transport factor 2 family protein [Phaeobacter sp. 11ANDIMAR09]